MPRLDLRKTPVLDAGEDLRLKQTAEDILLGVRQQAEDMGLHPFPRPSTAPPSLADIRSDDLQNQELGQLYLQLVAFAQYVNSQLADTKIAYNIAVNNRKHIEAKLQARLFAKGIPKTEFSTRIKEDPIYIEFDAEVVKLFAMRSLLEAHYKAYDKSAAALSRTIELRKLDFEQSMRASGVEVVKARKRAARPETDFGGKPVGGRRAFY